MVLTEEERKERKRIAAKKYREKNKEKKRIADKQYREKNKEKLKTYFKNNYQENKEYYDKKAIEWNKNNKERRKEIVAKNKEKNPHIVFKAKWKYRGVIWKDNEEYMNIWERYISTTNCDFCNIKFDNNKSTLTLKCLDHCHDTGKFRNIICSRCNLRRF